MADACLFVPQNGTYQPTEWAVGPWSPDTLQASAYGALLTRLLEADAPPGMLLARLSFDLWRPSRRLSLWSALAVSGAPGSSDGLPM